MKGRNCKVREASRPKFIAHRTAVVIAQRLYTIQSRAGTEGIVLS